jgi:BUD22
MDLLVESVRREITTNFIDTISEAKNERPTNEAESFQHPDMPTLRGSSVTIFDDQPVVSNESSKKTNRGDEPELNQPIPSEDESANQYDIGEEKRIPPSADIDNVSTVGGNQATTNNQIRKPSKQNPSLSPSLSPFPSESSEEQLPSHAAFKTSTFLPSLTEAGYLSGSDSEASDMNNDIAPRKNRRGQRARRLIAERKFGDTARHLQNEKPFKSARDKGWDARRGAVVHDANRRRFKDVQKLQSTSSRQPSTVEVRRLSEKNRGKDDSGPLHPSWIAKKTAKAKERVSATKFAGKKIVFD